MEIDYFKEEYWDFEEEDPSICDSFIGYEKFYNFLKDNGVDVESYIENLQYGHNKDIKKF